MERRRAGHHARPVSAGGGIVERHVAASLSQVSDPDKHDQWSDDEKVDPATVSSARWAYVLLPAAGDGCGPRRRDARGEQALAMADFNSTQAQLAAARTAHDAAQLAALKAAAQARQAQAALDLATRQASSQDEGAQ